MVLTELTIYSKETPNYIWKTTLDIRLWRYNHEKESQQLKIYKQNEQLSICKS